MQNISELLQKSLGKPKQRLVIAASEDLNVLEAVQFAVEKNLISPIFVGNIKQTIELAKSIKFNIEQFELIDTPDISTSAHISIGLIKNFKADILMKGLIPTANLLKVAVDKHEGIAAGKFLSHVALSQVKSYHKPILTTDCALNISPNFQKKVQIIENAVAVMHNLGYQNPKVAIICPVEKENAHIESTVHAVQLTQMNLDGKISGCQIFGPLALDNAISSESAKHKGIKNDVAGDADILLVPDLDSGNILYKAINFLASGTTAAIITGAQCPIVLTSRSDSSENKLYSIALAVCSVVGL
jgi:phosphate butyryltransferase